MRPSALMSVGLDGNDKVKKTNINRPRQKKSLHDDLYSTTV